MKQRRIPLKSCGLTTFTQDYPETLVLQDEDGGLHIYKLDETETAKTVIVAFGLDYRFSHMASETEEKELRERKVVIDMMQPDPEDVEDAEFNELILEAGKINATGSSLEN